MESERQALALVLCVGYSFGIMERCSAFKSPETGKPGRHDWRVVNGRGLGLSLQPSGPCYIATGGHDGYACVAATEGASGAVKAKKRRDYLAL